MATYSEEKTELGNLALQLDATQAFRFFLSDVEKFSTLDPHVKWVQESLKSRLEEVSEEDTVRTSALSWIGFRPVLTGEIPICPPHWPPWPPRPGLLWPMPHPWPWPWPNVPPFPVPDDGQALDGSLPRPLLDLRHGLVEGAELRQVMEQKLRGPLQADAIRRTAGSVEKWQRDAPAVSSREFDAAREELEEFMRVERWVGVAVGIGIGIAIGYGAAEVVHHHFAK